MSSPKKQSFFTRELLLWNANSNEREMPWKHEKDPYKIWLSEVILQQTRVAQGWDYYTRFVKKYPTVKKLAAAKDDEVFKLWEGLGYYSRCKNLLHTARFIATTCRGHFPKDYLQLLSLKGIGPYTAAAIASFAFNLPHAVVDGNVMRVLSRYFGDPTPIDSNEGKKHFTQLANSLLPQKDPAPFNQAIMDFGAGICTPRLPRCEDCVLQHNCEAFKRNASDLLPVKAKKKTATHRWMYYLVVDYKQQYYIRKRVEKDIWQNLYEFMLISSSSALTETALKSSAAFRQLIPKTAKLHAISAPVTHKLTHQTIHAQFIEISLTAPLLQTEFQLTGLKQLHKLAFPRLLRRYVEKWKISG